RRSTIWTSWTGKLKGADHWPWSDEPPPLPLETVTLITSVVWLPAASRATALSTWGPFVVADVCHEVEEGGAGSSAPSGAPSRRNWTPATKTLSEALAVTSMVPETVAPVVG